MYRRISLESIFLAIALFALTGLVIATQGCRENPTQPEPTYRMARAFDYSYYIFDWWTDFDIKSAKVTVVGGVNSRDVADIPSIRPMISLFDADPDKYRDNKFFIQGLGDVGFTDSLGVFQAENRLAAGAEREFKVVSPSFLLGQRTHFWFEVRFNVPVLYLGKNTTVIRGYVKL
jgi:hypothetical protein